MISEEDKKNFEFEEIDTGESKAEIRNSDVANWVGTWNNPTLTDEEFLEFLKTLQELGYLEYGIFQREKGEENGTIHFQFFLSFTHSKRFTWVKKNLPYGCHFKPMISTKTRCRNYCSKEETRVSGPYEIGEFKEERKNGDFSRAVRMIEEGFSLKEISETFPVIYVMFGKRLQEYYDLKLKWKYEKECRNVEVFYVYGEPRVGKTTWVNSQFDFEDVFVVENYGKYLFTGYEKQDVVIFDEFCGQVNPITALNKLLEPFPQRLRKLNGIVQACFTKVYIISNYALKDIYKDEQLIMNASYRAFINRINHIIHFDSKGQRHIEKETIFEDIPENEVKFKGLTKRISKIVEYDYYGKAQVKYDRYNQFEQTMIEIPKEIFGE